VPGGIVVVEDGAVGAELLVPVVDGASEAFFVVVVPPQAPDSPAMATTATSAALGLPRTRIRPLLRLSSFSFTFEDGGALTWLADSMIPNRFHQFHESVPISDSDTPLGGRRNGIRISNLRSVWRAIKDR
jgi:hypothetical protein